MTNGVGPDARAGADPISFDYPLEAGRWTPDQPSADDQLPESVAESSVAVVVLVAPPRM